MGYPSDTRSNTDERSFEHVIQNRERHTKARARSGQSGRGTGATIPMDWKSNSNLWQNRALTQVRPGSSCPAFCLPVFQLPGPPGAVLVVPSTGILLALCTVGRKSLPSWFSCCKTRSNLPSVASEPRRLYGEEARGHHSAGTLQLGDLSPTSIPVPQPRNNPRTRVTQHHHWTLPAPRLAAVCLDTQYHVALLMTRFPSPSLDLRYLPSMYSHDPAGLHAREKPQFPPTAVLPPS